MGVRHVALFRFVEGTTSEQIDAINAKLAELPGEIPELRSYVYGADLGLAPTTWDFGVVADVDDEESYVAYRDHPAHRRVVEEVFAPIVAERASVQLTLP